MMTKLSIENSFDNYVLTLYIGLCLSRQLKSIRVASKQIVKSVETFDSWQETNLSLSIMVLVFKNNL